MFTKDAANRQGQGVSYAFTIDSADISKTIQISFDFDGSLTGYSAGDLTAYIYDVTNSVLITPAAVSLAQAKYQFQTTFVASASTSYRLILHVASTSTTAYTAKVDNVIVGPQLLTLGTPFTNWQSYSLSVTASTTAPTFGTVTNNAARWRIVGGSLELDWNFAQSTAGTAGTGLYYFSLPSGYTVDSSVATIDSAGTVASCLGNAWMNRAGGPLDAAGIVVALTSTKLGVIIDGSSDPIGSTTQGAFNAALQMKFRAMVPVAQLAGSSVYLNTAQPEYAYNSSTNNGNDTTSFAYGPTGQQLINLSSTGITKRVRFLTPVQETDKVQFQYYNNGRWLELGETNNISSYERQSGQEYGVYLNSVSGSTTDIDVTFAGYRLATSATYGAAGTDWSAIAGSANYKWRLVKIPGQVQVATPSISAISPAVVTFNSWNPSDLAGTSTDANSLGTGGGLTDNNITVSSISGGATTITFGTAGLYEVQASINHTSQANATRVQLIMTYGGTASSTYVGNWISRVAVPGGTDNPIVSSGDYFTSSAAAGQTLTIRGQFSVVGSGSTSNHIAIARYFIRRIR